MDSEVRRAVVSGNEKKVNAAGAQRGRVRDMQCRQRETWGFLKQHSETPHFLNLLLFFTVTRTQLDRVEKS